MARKRVGTCEIRWCMAKNQPLIQVHENIGDGSFLVEICEGCAGILGLKERNDLPAPETVRRKLKAARKVKK